MSPGAPSSVRLEALAASLLMLMPAAYAVMVRFFPLNHCAAVQRPSVDGREELDMLKRTCIPFYSETRRAIEASASAETLRALLPGETEELRQARVAALHAQAEADTARRRAMHDARYVDGVRKAPVGAEASIVPAGRKDSPFRRALPREGARALAPQA